MQVELWQALTPVLIGGIGLGLYKLLSVGSDLTKVKTDSAIALMAEYGKQLDRHKEDIERLTGESASLREQITNLLGLVGTRDQELATVRAELATVRAELATERSRRVELERQVNRLPRRHDDPPPPPLAAV